MAGQFVTAVSDAEFEKEVLQSEQPVLVDFWAAWCGPCRALAPVVDEVASFYNGKLKVMKMDVTPTQPRRSVTAFAAFPRCCSSRAARSPSRCGLRAQGHDRQVDCESPRVKFLICVESVEKLPGGRSRCRAIFLPARRCFRREMLDSARNAGMDVLSRGAGGLLHSGQ